MRAQLLTIAALGAAVMLSPAASTAQGRRAKPSGAEIAAKAREVRFDQANVGVGEFQGKKMMFTPADFSHLKSVEDFKAGQVVGLLENGAPGDETGLPPGRYHLFVAEVDGQWHAYAESRGQIVREAIRANVEAGDRPASSKKPQFQEKGWCYQVMIWPWPLVYLTICF